MARLFTCADVLEQLEDSNGDVSSGAYEGEGIVPKATSFMPDLSGMHDMDLDASGMDQDGERPLTVWLWQVV